jgi:aerobic carbon-monoxide dehydrogenase medium subunit
LTPTRGLLHPRTVAEAVTLLVQLPQARILAGGATLVAMINARLVEPEVLISLSEIDELRGVHAVPRGGFRIGAMTRHRETASERRFDQTLSVLPLAAGQIANVVVRNMGTIGGSVSFADPGLDYPPALVAANAEIEIASASGRRVVPAAEFFVDWYTTALDRAEMVTAVLLPPARPGVGLYHKLARVSGDYATVSVAMTMEGSSHGLVTRVAVGACGPRPILLEEVNELLSGHPTRQDLERAGSCLRAAADPVDDARGTAEYRRVLIPRMLERAFEEARKTFATKQ